MTKLSLLPLPLTVENRVPQKGVCIKTESNCEETNHGLVETVQTETTLISVHQELKQDDFSTLNGGTLTNIIDAADLLRKKPESWDSLIKSVEQSAEAEEPRTTSPGSKERKRMKQNPALDVPALWGFTSVCGRRKEMEDSVVALPRFLSFPSSMVGNDIPELSSHDQHLSAHVFGVYDGHGGCQVANYCRDRLHLALAEEIGIAKENWHIEPGECVWEAEWMKIFVNCFRKLDDEVGGFPMAGGDAASPIAPGSVGSTAVVAVVCSTHIIVANCGDSRAVLCRGKVAMPLSVDHKPNREDECLRIEAAGGRVIKWDGYRVSGFLAVSRSIGDRYLRPFVVADPEVMIVPRAKEDECLILASDGLWDVVTNEEACDLARRRIKLWDKKNGNKTGEEVDAAAQDAADYLLRLAFQRGSRDNISVIVVDLKPPRKFKKTT